MKKWKRNEKMLKYDKFMRRGKKKAQEIEIEMRITSQHSTMSPDRREIGEKKFRRKKEMLQWSPLGRTMCLNS